MASDAASNMSRGLIFGAALAASGVASPSILIGQFSLRESHMLKVFLTASASSAIVFALYKSSRPSGLQPRKPSSLGRTRWAYDGNAAGGALLGLGMALTGSCPGTIFVQLAAGVPSALPVFCGALAGGVLHRLLDHRIRQRPDDDDGGGGGGGGAGKKEEPLTVAQWLGVDARAALLVYEALLTASIVTLVRLQRTPAGMLHPVLGGLFIGSAQLASVALTGGVLGTSSSFEEAASWILWAWARLRQKPGEEAKAKKPSSNTLRFVMWLTAGSYLAMRVAPRLRIQDGMPASSATLFLGGVAMIFGSRMAGGCTSGHGISGMSLMALSSMWTVVSIFAAGTAVGCLLHP